MQAGKVQVAMPPEITMDDLHDAYVFCRLRRMGIGMAKVLETPHLFAALKNTAIARKKAKQKIEDPTAAQQELILGRENECTTS